MTLRGFIATQVGHECMRELVEGERNKQREESKKEKSEIGHGTVAKGQDPC